MRYFKSGSVSAFCLTVAGDTKGLFMSMSLPIFRIGHPSLFVPWEDISFRPGKNWMLKCVDMEFKRVSGVTFQMSRKTAMRLRPQDNEKK
jgi:hypothetical protein